MPWQPRSATSRSRLATPIRRRSLERALALGAEDRGEIAQRDTYFAGARGRLKLREQTPGERRADPVPPRRRGRRRAPASTGSCRSARRTRCARRSTPPSAPSSVVEKRRRLLLWDGVRIHLDDVEGLGTFVELEATDEDPGQGRAPARGARDRRPRRRRATPTCCSTRPRTCCGRRRGGDAQRLRARTRASRSAPRCGPPTGAVYAGANVENAAYPQGQCAEASAIGALVAAGEREIVAVAVVAEQMDVCPPCGGCRQRLAEFGAADTPVYLGPVARRPRSASCCRWRSRSTP